MAGTVTLGLAASLLAVTTSAEAVNQFTTPVANPDLPVACGLDVVLALDQSKSIATSNAAVQVKSAAATFLEAFQDTSTRVGLVKFSTGASASVPLTYVTTASNGAGGVHKAALDTYAPATTQGTNWEAAIKTARIEFATAPARPGVHQLLVMITDGSANVAIDPGTGQPTPLFPNDQDPAAINPAIDQANTFKLAGGHVLAVGVGAAFDNSAPGQTRQSLLQHLSEYPFGQISPTTAFSATTTDTVLDPALTNLKANLKALASQVCDGSLSVTQLATSPSAPNTYGNGGSGWSLTTTVSPVGDWTAPTVDPTAASEVAASNSAGTSLFQWSNAAPSWTKTAEVAVAMKANYSLDHVTCNVNNGANATATVVGSSFTVPGGVGAGKVVACTVYTKYTGPLVSLLTLNPRAKIATYGATTTVFTGIARDPIGALKGKTITLQALPAGGKTWLALGHRTSTTLGAYAFSVKPLSNTYYRVTYAGDAGHLVGYSANSVIRVADKVALKVSRNGVVKGTKVTFTGAVAPNKRGAKVYLQRLVSGRWKNVTTGVLSARSTFAIVWKTDSRVDFKWRVVKVADVRNYTGISNVILLKVI